MDVAQRRSCLDQLAWLNPDNRAATRGGFSSKATFFSRASREKDASGDDPHFFVKFSELASTSARRETPTILLVRWFGDAPKQGVSVEWSTAVSFLSPKGRQLWGLTVAVLHPDPAVMTQTIV